MESSGPDDGGVNDGGILAAVSVRKGAAEATWAEEGGGGVSLGGGGTAQGKKGARATVLSPSVAMASREERARGVAATQAGAPSMAGEARGGGQSGRRG